MRAGFDSQHPDKKEKLLIGVFLLGVSKQTALLATGIEKLFVL
jgi:hypothetical protein